MRNLLSKFFFVLVVLALVGLPVFGQATSTGSLAGTVTDPKGAVIAGATVKLVSDETKQEFTAQTSGEGTFNIPALFSGMYTATISMQGFKTAKVTEIKVAVGTPSSISVAPEIGDAIQEVARSADTTRADSTADGAVQIEFITQAGGNEYHRRGYWYFRNPALSANYWFNNRDLPADPVTGKAPQQRILLNQFGAKM